VLRRNSALTVLAPKLPPPVALELSRCPKVLAPSREAGSTKASIAVIEKQAKMRRKLVGAAAASARKDVVLDVALDPRRRPATPSRILCPAPRNGRLGIRNLQNPNRLKFLRVPYRVFITLIETRSTKQASKNNIFAAKLALLLIIIKKNKQVAHFNKGAGSEDGPS